MIYEILAEISKSSDLRPLQYLASVRVAISVCESKDLQYMIRRFCKTNGNRTDIGFSYDQWDQLRRKAERKLDKIGVPDIIIELILENLWPISFEIYKWIVYHGEDTGIDISSKFSWTSRANIDFVKTAEILTRNEALDIKKRYKLACIYCLEPEIRSSWDQMSLSEIRCFFHRGNLKRSKQNPIILYWTYYVQEVEMDYWDSKVLNPSHLLKYAVENGYLSATEFFLGKIKNNLRNRMISNCFDIHIRELYKTGIIAKDHLGIICFLISLFRWDDSEMRYFRNLSLFLLYLLEWPRQKHFMTTATRLERCFNDFYFGHVLVGIFAKIVGDFKDYDYKKVFVEFWNYPWRDSARYRTCVRTDFKFGSKILIEFVKKHFGFVFEGDSLTKREKLRTAVSQQECSENDADFEKENVEFFKFLVRERVALRASIERLSNHYPTPDQEPVEASLLNLRLEELMYLMDRILENV